MMRGILALGLVGALAIAAPLEAQGHGKGKGKGRGKDGVPPGHRPSAGQCRVWYDGTPPGHQPRATDCATARRVAARTGGRVIYGDDRYDRRDDERYDRRDDDRYERRRDDDRYEDRDKRRDGSWEGIERRGDGPWEETGSKSCADRDRDGRCDVPVFGGGRAASLPEMIGVMLLRDGRRTADQTQWLGREGVRAKWEDRDGNRIPESIRWFDRSGQLVQRWVDGNRDGRADYVQMYRNGKLVATKR